MPLIPIINHEAWIEKFERIVKIIQDYDSDVIRLTKTEHNDMWAVQRDILNECRHPQLVEVHKKVTWENNDYGHSWHTDNKCEIICAYCDTQTKKTRNEHCALTEGYLNPFKVFAVALVDNKRTDVKMEHIAYSPHHYRWKPQGPTPPPQPLPPIPKPEHLTKLEHLEQLNS